MLTLEGLLLPWLVVGCLLGLIGEGVVRAVGPSRPGWRRWFHRTIFAHPVIAGALIGLSPTLPVPPAMGDGWAGSIVWYALAGGLGAIIYRGVRGFLEARARRAEAGEVPRGFATVGLLVIGAVAGIVPLLAHGTPPAWPLVAAGLAALGLAGGVLYVVVAGIRAVLRMLT